MNFALRFWEVFWQVPSVQTSDAPQAVGCSQVFENRFYSTFYYNFFVGNWFSQNALREFCQTLLSVVNLWLQPTSIVLI